MDNKKAARPGRQGGNDLGSHHDIGEYPIPKQAEYRAGRFTLIRQADMPEPEPRQEIVEGLLAAGEVMLLTGKPKSGKSLLAAHLAAAITTGSDFCGRGVKKGRVVFLALERHALDRRRVAAAGADPQAMFWTPFRDRIDLSDTDEMTALADAVRQVGPVLVVVDTAAKAMPDLDENSSRDTGRAMAGVEVLQDQLPDAAIVIVHHLDKGGVGPRGSGAILAAADIELRVERSDVGGHLRTARVTQANDIDEGQQLVFAIEDRDGEAVAVPCDLPGVRRAPDGARAQRNAALAAGADEKALRMLRACPGTFDIEKLLQTGLDVQAIADTANPRSMREVARKVLKRLEGMDFVTPVGRGKYEISAAGRAACNGHATGIEQRPATGINGPATGKQRANNTHCNDTATPIAPPLRGAMVGVAGERQSDDR